MEVVLPFRNLAQTIGMIKEENNISDFITCDCGLTDLVELTDERPAGCCCFGGGFCSSSLEPAQPMFVVSDESVF